ncbi:MAG: PCRF domain-containing protein [Patescibacteria group bacterium]|jgi:peptide chain release factor 1
MSDAAVKYLEEELSRLEAKLAETEVLKSDPAIVEMAAEEAVRIESEIENLKKAIESGGETTVEEEQVGESFKSILLETRQGVGGDEAKIWADDLARMYMRYATASGFKVEQLDEGVMKISGKGIYDLLKWETGVHRVQRVPETEASGRIHTSTASVVVLPEVPESRVDVREDDLIWEFTRGGGHGGQNVNKVATAVRLTHRPSGIVVNCRQERSQEQNRKVALSMLRSQLWEIEQEKKLSALADQRSAIGRSMRSEKIRTYNYPQNRVTDHRIGKSWHKLERIIEGDLADMFASLAVELGKDHSDSNDDTTDYKGNGDGLSEPKMS